MFWPIFISAVSFWGIALTGGLLYGRRYVRAIEALRERVAELESVVVAQTALPRGTPSTAKGSVVS